MNQFSTKIISPVSSVMSGNDPVFNYYAWPSITKTKDGKIIVGASGFRKRHVCPYGKAVIAESFDEGKTYGLPYAVIDTCLDDRDCGLAPFGDNGLIVTSFNNSTDFQRKEAQRLTDEKELQSTLAHLKSISLEDEESALGSNFRVSFDNGKTFGEIYKSPVRSPHGPIELKNGEILWCGESLGGRDDKGIKCYKLDPYTGRMEKRGEIPEITEGEEKFLSFEPYMIELPSGKLLCHIRAQRPGTNYTQMTLFQSVSEDAGKTWSMPERILGEDGGAPAHLLQHSSGLLISLYSYRMTPFEIRAIVSKDEGASWSEPITLCDTAGITADMGYPMSVEKENGEIITVFYCHDFNGSPAVIKQITWTIEERKTKC